MRSYAAKGKLVPGSDDERRFLELVRIEAGGERVVVVVARWERERVQEFYGQGRRWFYEMMEMGEKMGVEPPWEDPVELGRWFAKARGLGLRKKAPPPPVEARIRTAEVASLKAAGLPVVDEAPGEAPASGKSRPKPPPFAQPDLPVVGPGRSDAQATLNYLEQRAFFLEQQVLKLNALGRFDEAAVFAAELKDIHKDKRAWSLSTPKIKAGDEETQAQLKADMALFAGGFWQIMRRAFLTGCPPAEKPLREAVLNTIATDLPDLLEEHFGLRETAAAAPDLAA